jgi:hypothetical protein
MPAPRDVMRRSWDDDAGEARHGGSLTDALIMELMLSQRNPYFRQILKLELNCKNSGLGWMV